MAVGLLHRRPRRGADVSEEQGRLDVRGEIAQVGVAPRRRDAPVAGWGAAVAVAVPAEAEAVPVGRLHAHTRVKALVDETVLGAKEQFIDQHGLTEIGVPAAHQRLLTVQRRTGNAAPQRPQRQTSMIIAPRREPLKGADTTVPGGCALLRRSWGRSGSPGGI